MVNTFERVNNVKVPYKFVDRRSGDVAECYADPSKAKKRIKLESRTRIRRYVSRCI